MLHILQLTIGSGISLLFLMLVFIPLEKAFPAKENQKVFRKKWLLDLSYFLGQYLIWNGLVLFALYQFQIWLNAHISFQFRELVTQQYIWLQIIEIIVLSDFLIYWGHRFQHNNDFLWRFHKVHHTAETMDWLAAHREHPLDSIYTIGLINLPAIILGFDLSIIAAITAFRGLWAIYVHSNVRIPLGPLKILIGSPELHHWHHDKERDRGNYANLSPIMDKLFGTYVCPPKEPEEFGIKQAFPQTYISQLIRPMLPSIIWNRMLKFFRK